MECTLFFEKVKRYFRYLTDEYSFSIVTEKEGKSFDNCIIEFESNDCRVRIVRDRGSAVLEIAPSSTSDAWSGASLPWLELGTVIDFLTRRPVAEGWKENSPDPSLRGDAVIEWELAKMASELQAHCDQVIELFREDVYRQKQAELKEFRKKRWEEIKKFIYK